MKKIGIVLLALALGGGFLAAERATWSVSGWAKTEWGYKFAEKDAVELSPQDWDTGFRTEAGASLKLTFLGETSRVGEGAGNWRGYIELKDFSVDNLANEDVKDENGKVITEKGDALTTFDLKMPTVVAKILYKDFLYFQLTSASTKANYAKAIEDLLVDSNDLDVQAAGIKVDNKGVSGGLEVGFVLDDIGTIRAAATTETSWADPADNFQASYYAFLLAFEGVAIADFLTPSVAFTWNNGQNLGAHVKVEMGLPVLAGLGIALGTDFIVDMVQVVDNQKFIFSVDALLEAELAVVDGFSVGASTYFSYYKPFADQDGIHLMDTAVELKEASGDEGLIPVLGASVTFGMPDTTQQFIEEFNFVINADVDATFGDFEVKAGYEYVSAGVAALTEKDLVGGDSLKPVYEQENDYLEFAYNGIDKTRLYTRYEVPAVEKITDNPGAIWIGAKVTF